MKQIFNFMQHKRKNMVAGLTVHFKLRAFILPEYTG